MGRPLTVFGRSLPLTGTGSHRRRGYEGQRARWDRVPLPEDRKTCWIPTVLMKFSLKLHLIKIWEKKETLKKLSFFFSGKSVRCSKNLVIFYDCKSHKVAHKVVLSSGNKWLYALTQCIKRGPRGPRIGEIEPVPGVFPIQVRPARVFFFSRPVQPWIIAYFVYDAVQRHPFRIAQSRYVGPC